MTPAQIKRIIAISATALCAILAVGAIIAACTVAWPIGLAAVVLVGIGIGTAIYAATREDLDSPERREKVMQEIARKSLEQVARDYSPEQIVEYALLDRTIVQGGDTTQTRAVAYARFQRLAQELNRASGWTQENKENAREGIYRAATQTFKHWYHDQKGRLADARRMREQEREIDHLRRANQHLAGKPPRGCS